MTWKKRIISIALCLCALLCAASVRADAAEHSHPICGASHKNVGDHTSDNCSTPTWTAWNGTTTINNDFFGSFTEKYLYLSQDVTPGDYIIVPEGKTLYLCLNGHSLKSKAYYAIYVSGTLVLCDCNGSGQGEGAISHGEEDGSICGAEGIYVIDNAIFTMYGGTISNNDGRGVLVSGGTFTMYGGEISDNTCITESAGGGGGVWVKDDDSNIGNFTMYGGTICKNTYKGIGNCGGGGVYASGTGDFIIQGGEITNNQCSYNATNTSNGASGGGLYISGKPRELKIENCTISNNTCDGEGGGIFINCANVTGTITGCTISGNEAGGNGGGFASQDCILTIGNCNITNNKTMGNGGAMAVGSWGEDSKITLSGSMNFSGNAQGCTADKNGKLTGDTANDVHLNTSRVYLRLASDFSKTSGAIVVTTSSAPSNKNYKKIAEDNRTTPNATDFTYGNDSNIGIIAKTNNGKVELLACKHNYSTQKDETNHWQECSICGDKKDVTKHTYSNTWKKNSTQHWHECECGAKSGEADHAYSNEWKTGDGKHWHECACGQKSEEAEHSYSTAWQRDGTSHFHECFCGNKKDITTCVYDQEYVSSNYRVSNATCTAKAVYHKSCVCDRAGTATFEYGEKDPNNHTGTLGSWQSNDDGHWKEYSCCRTKVQEGTHNWNEGEVTTPATCTTVGVKTLTCNTCKATKTEPVPATGHTYNQTKVEDKYLVSAATCTAKAVYYKSCVCGATDTSTAETFESGKPLGHTGGEATCTQKATCTRCNQEYGDPLGHDLVHHEAKTATCTAVGWDAYDTCTRCDYTTYVEKAALGHDFTVPKYDEIQHWYKCANCTATTEPVAHTDFTAWKSDRSGHWHECSTCGYKTAVNAHTPDRDKATETTPQLCTECGYVIAPATHPVHTWVFVAGTPATCNAAGEREHYKCTCGRTSFKNGDAYDINEDASVLTIAASHTGNIGEQWHSDSANHWQEYTCCHARANEAAHSGGAATCTAQAVCEVCGKAYGPLAAHAWQPATCTEPKTCSVCHVTEGAALGHDWGAWKVTTPATKDAPGVETRTCTYNSAHTETRSIPKLSTTVYTVSEDTKIAQIEAKVDGLDKILESDENKALVNDGKSVGVSLTVKNTASSGVSEKIKEKLAGSNLVGLRLELTVEKTVTANGVVEPKQTIHDAGVLLNTTITLPAELQGKSGYVVYRLHDGNVHVLTETANENGEFISVSADKTQITICARLYSEYVIAYQTGGSSGGGYHPVNPAPVKATSANTGDAGVLLYGVTAALSLTGTAWLGAKSRKH